MHISSSYGVHEQDCCDSALAFHCDNIKRLGYSIVDNVVSDDFVVEIRKKFDLTLQDYQEKFGTDNLRAIDEHNGIRMPFYFDKVFLKLATNELVLSIVTELMGSNYILNQQNGISNPGNENYNQSKWHRDLPYSHYTSSRPLMVNALFCVDDFKITNGGTRVIPGSHLFESFPSEKFIDNNSITVEANAGSFIILDSMLYHSGTHNSSPNARRAVNNVYASPHIKQQINFSLGNTQHLGLTNKEKSLLGVNFNNYESVDSYLASRKS